MIDPVLSGRLDALEQNLKRVKEQPSLWQSEWDVQRAGMAIESLWRDLDMTIGRQVKSQLGDLLKIRQKLKQAEQIADATAAQQLLAAAWRDYAELYHRCQEIFRESLEFLGGLAFRDKYKDEQIFQVADELIVSCAQLVWDRNPSVTIPSSQDALAKTMGRIIRLRFPEWPIWTLPFAAHEYGHLVIEEVEQLRTFVQEQMDAWQTQEPDVGDRRAQYHLQEFLADAFATYNMGPAYGCAAILLRLNPAPAHAEDDEHPVDAWRAEVILSMLRRMNDAAGVLKPYADVIAHLAREWEATLAHAALASGPDAGVKARLAALVDAVWDQFDLELRLTARYPHTGDDGWVIARAWAETWLDQLGKGQALEVKIANTSKLRDALNAAWLCRVYKPDASEKIGEAAQRLCQDIIAQRRQPPTQRVQPPSRRGR